MAEIYVHTLKYNNDMLKITQPANILSKKTINWYRIHRNYKKHITTLNSSRYSYNTISTV